MQESIWINITFNTPKNKGIGKKVTEKFNQSSILFLPVLLQKNLLNWGPICSEEIKSRILILNMQVCIDIILSTPFCYPILSVYQHQANYDENVSCHVSYWVNASESQRTRWEKYGYQQHLASVASTTMNTVDIVGNTVDIVGNTWWRG